MHITLFKSNDSVDGLHNIVPYDYFINNISNTAHNNTLVVELDVTNDNPEMCSSNLGHIKYISLTNINCPNTCLKYLDIFKDKHIFMDKFVANNNNPVDYKISDTLKQIFDCTNIDWLKKIVSLDLIFSTFKNIRLIDEYYNDISLALLLSTQNSVPLIASNYQTNDLIMNGLMYRKKMDEFIGGLDKNDIHMPSIKTEFNIIRLNNCVILERSGHGFFFLNRHYDDYNINDIYLDWDTNLLGLYKLIDNNIELYVKVVISGRNKIIIGLNNIKKGYGYYFYKISDDVGEYNISGPSILKLSGDTNIKKTFTFNKGKYSQKHNELPTGVGRINKVEEPKVFCPKSDDFPALVKKKK